MTYREAREQAGLSLDKVAEKIGVSKTAVYLWETGETEPRLENLRRLATIYGVSIADFSPCT